MKLSSKAGFSLVQVMVAAGIMGMMALALTQMMDTSNKQINYIDFKMSLMDFRKEINSHLSLSENCVQTFDQKEFSPENLNSTPLKIDSIVNPNNKALFKVGNKYYRQLILDSLSLRAFEPASKDTPNKGIAVLDYKVSAIKNVLGPSALTRSIRLNMVFDKDNDTVLNCNSLGEGGMGIGGDNDIFKSRCQARFGIYGSNNTCKFFNPQLIRYEVSYRIWGSTQSLSSSFSRVNQLASKNANAFCQSQLGASSFAISFYESMEGRSGKQYMGTKNNDLTWKKFTTSRSGGGLPLLEMIVCSK